MMKKCLLAVTLLILCINAFAEDSQDSTKHSLPAANTDFNYSIPERYVVEDIVITGLKYLDPAQVDAITGISKGDTIQIPGQDLQFLMKKLWAQRYFSNVELKGLNVNGDRVTLNIHLEERPRVSSWDFEGVRKGEKEDLREKLNLRRGGDLSDYLIETSINAIKKHYAEKGFLNAEVNIRQEKDTIYKGNDFVKIIFVVNKNSKVKIKDIFFEGNDNISDSKLRRSMKDTKRKRLSTIFKSSKFIRSKYEEDLDNLITYYNEKGYRDAKVVSDSVEVLNEKRVALHIKVNEGKQYFFRNITWVGNSVLSDEVLNQILSLKKGDIFDKTAMEKMLYIDEQSVMTTYNDMGYLFFNVNPVETNIVGDSIDVEMRIVEGDQARFNRINIAGNDRTNEHVIRRELLTKPGELYSKTQIIESIRRLNNTGYFDPEKLGTGIQIVPNQDGETVDVTYNLTEKPNDQLEISGGYGNNMFVGTLGVRFSNFSTRRIFEKGAWRPIPSGDGQTLTLRAQTNGKHYSALSLGFVEPWLGGKKPTSLSVSAYHTRQTNGNYWNNYISNQYMRVTGLAVGLGKRLKWPDHNFTASGELSWQHYALRDWQGMFIFDNGRSNNLSIKGTFGRYTVDNPIYPREGSDFSLSLQLTPPYSLIGKEKDYSTMDPSEKYKWVEYHKWTFKGTVYTQLIDKLVLMTKVQFGYLGYYNKKLGYSPFEGYYVGGDGMSGYAIYGQENIGLRGYRNGSLTPTVRTDYGQNVSIGNSYVKYTAEFRYPIIMEPQSSIYVLAFLEAGNSWYDLSNFNPFAVKRSAGVGVRLLLPIVGMIGFHYGYGFDSVPGSSGAGGGQFHFEMGIPM